MTQIRSVLGPILHVGFVVHHVYALGYSHHMQQKIDQPHITDPRILDMKTFGALFFTTWNLTFQMIYFALAMLHDWLNIFSLSPGLKDKVDSWKGFLFTSFVFPSTIFVFTMFWGVYSINREWVLPEVCDEYVPKWLNHSLHTNIVVFLIIEVLIANQLLPSFKSAFIALTVLAVIYDVIFFIAYFVYGRWIYGIFYVFTWTERIAFVLFNYLCSVSIMKIGIFIENFKYTLSKNRLKKIKA